MNETEMLREIGMNGYETNCYLALWKYGTLMAKDCAAHAKVPKTKVHEALRSLEEKGLIMVEEGKPKRFRTLPLKEGLLSFVGSQEAKLEELKKELKKSLVRIPRVKPGVHEEKIVTMRGGAMQSQLALDITRHAISELLIIRAATKISTNLLLETRKAVKRGVNVRYVATNWDSELFKKLKSFGYRVRYWPKEILFLAVRDRKQSMLVVKNPEDPEDSISILINDEGLSKAHATFFDSIWKKSRKM